MNNAEILAAIAADSTLQGMAAAGNTQGIADALSAGRTKTVSHFASERGILERFPLGPLAGDELLAKLEAFAATAHPMARIVGRALKFLAQPDGLDIGSPATQGLLDALAAAGVISAEERAGLVQMVTAADPVSHTDVGVALQGVQ